MADTEGTQNEIYITAELPMFHPHFVSFNDVFIIQRINSGD